MHHPTLYISKYFKNNREKYYENLKKIHLDGDYNSWIKFFLNGIIEISNESVNIAREINILRAEDLKKINLLGKLSSNGIKIYEKLFSKPTITALAASEVLNVTRSNSYRLLERMCDIGILSHMNNRVRERTYVYKNYLDKFNRV